MDDHQQLYQTGRSLMDDGDVDGAIAKFEASARLLPHFKTLELLGECLVRTGQLTEAVVWLAAATALNRGVRAPSLLAEVFLKLDDKYRAEDLVEIALQRDPRNHRALAVKDALTQDPVVE